MSMFPAVWEKGELGRSNNWTGKSPTLTKRANTIPRKPCGWLAAGLRSLGIRQVVVTSTHGFTVLQAAEIFRGSEIELIAVSISTAFHKEGWTMSSEERSKAEQAGVRVLTNLHGLADGVTEGLYGEHTPGSVVANTLRMFSQGMKVAVEVSIMALEAGLIPAGREIIACGGTDEGCDTAVVVQPAHARKIN